jgi:hypothetical protein
MYYLLQIAVQKVETINNNTNSYDLVENFCHLLIRCLNTIGSQQEISTTKVVSYLLNLPNHVTNYGLTYISWYSLSTWENEQEIK